MSSRGSCQCRKTTGTLQPQRMTTSSPTAIFAGPRPKQTRSPRLPVTFMVKSTLFHVVASTRCKNFRSLDDVEMLINCETSISVLPLRNEYSQAFSYQLGGLAPPGPLSATNVRQKASGTGWERSDQPASLLHSRG